MSCVEKVKHNVKHCKSENSLQIFFDDAKNRYTGWCFSCAAKGLEAYVENPYNGEVKRDPPKVKTKEEIEEEIAEIRALKNPDFMHRGIDPRYFKGSGVRLALSEYDGTTPNSFNFPFTLNGELLGYKTILLDKKVMWSVGNIKGADLFNWEIAKKKGTKRLYVTEGECFLPSAEVLTPDGWASLADWDGQSVMSGLGSFEQPSAFVEKDYDGELIEYRSGSYYSITTPQHNLARISNDGSIFKCPAESTNLNRFNVPRVVNFKSDSNNLMARLQVMLSADFTFREGGDLYGGFLKARKIERAEKLLDLAGVRYSKYLEGSGRTAFFIHRGHNLGVSKLFDYTRDLGSASTIIEELLYWDGNSVPNRNQIEYASKELSNAEFIQTCAHICGYSSSIIKRSNAFGEWYKVSILYSKKSSSTQKGYKKVVYSGKVNCLTVPSGLLLVRQNGSISVSGNCDCLALQHMLEYSCNFKYKYAVTSLPHGVGSAAVTLGRMRKEIESLFDEVVLVFDNDIAGDKAVKDVMKVMPNILEAPHVSGIKDANDALLSGNYSTFVDYVMWKARTPPIQGIITVSQTLERGIKPPELGLSYPWATLTDILYGQRFGESICVAGAVSSGKTLIAHEIAAWNMIQHGLPCFTALLEEQNHKTLWNIAAKIDSIPYNRPEVYEANKEKFHDTIAKLESLLFMWNSQGNSSSRFDMDEILSGIRFNAVEYGIKSAFIDNMTRLTDHLNTGEANEFINKYSSEVANLAEELDINIFLYSHLNPPKGNNVRSHEEGAEIFPSQLTGSRGVMRSFPTILGFERNQFAEGDLASNSYLGVLKSRDYGGKKKIKTQYSSKTGRLLEHNWVGDSLF